MSSPKFVGGAPALGLSPTITRLAAGGVRPKARERGARRYLPGGWAPRALPINTFVIEHSQGVCLFDTGQTARATRPGHLPAWHPFLRLARFELTADDEPAAGLARRGIRPADIAVVVLSHLHTDHVGTVAAFPAAEILVARAEWEHATGLAGRMRGYVPQHWPDAIVPTLVDFDGGPRGPWTATHDVFGDGVLLLVPLPGHSPGHLGLLVDVAPRALMAGDLAHRAAEVATAAPAVAAFCAEEQVAVLCAHDEDPPVPGAPSGAHHRGDRSCA